MKNIGTFRHAGARIIGVRTHDAARRCDRVVTTTTTKFTIDAQCQCAACVKRRKTRDRRKPIVTIADINEANRGIFARKEKP